MNIPRNEFNKYFRDLVKVVNVAGVLPNHANQKPEFASRCKEVVKTGDFKAAAKIVDDLLAHYKNGTLFDASITQNRRNIAKNQLDFAAGEFAKYFAKSA